MNLEHARVILRPRTIAELFDLSLRFCTILAGRTYLSLSAIVLVPCLLAVWAVHHGYERWPLTWAAALALAALVRPVFTIAASRLLFEARPRLRDIFGHLLRRSLTLLLALLFYLLVLGVSAVMLVVPLLFMMVLLTFLDEAVLLEHQGPVRALSRASALLRRRSPAIVSLRLGQAVAVALFIVSAEQLGHGVVDFVLQLGAPLGDLWDGGGSAYALVGFFLSLPFIATAQFLTYIDGRTRMDGWDIQLRFLAIAARPAEDEP
jgi:hypothetical protein